MRGYFFIFFCLIFFGSEIHAQTPALDPMWGLPNWSDDFTSASLDPLKWSTGDYFNGWCTDQDCNYPGAYQAYHTSPTSGYGNFLFDPTGVGTLSLVVKALNPAISMAGNSLPNCTPCTTKTYNYTAPMQMSSVSNTFGYGYYEMRCRLPALSLPATNQGIGANFWMFEFHPANNYNVTEIDIFEFVGTSHVWTMNSHFRYCSNPTDPVTCNPSSPSMIDNQNIFGSLSFSGYHKFGVGYYPGKIEYFLDDNLVFTANPSITTPRTMQIILDLNVGPSGDYIDGNTVLPYYYEIDYVKAYKLVFDCLTSYNPTVYNIPVYDNKVKLNVGIGGLGKTYVVPTSINISLKASNSITIDEGFEVGSSSVFMADVISCQ